MKTIKHNRILGSTFMVIALIFAQSCKEKNTQTSVTNTKANYTQVATGQIHVYDENGNVVSELKPGDSLYGQDAHYLKGKKMSFKKNNDGTITDNNTGLMWEEIPTTEGFDWQGAKDYVENLELGGYDDWRLPTAKELFSISDFSEGWPYLDTTYFSLVNNEHVDKSEQYWTANKYLGHTEEGQYTAVFGVNHATGHIKAYPGEAPKDRKDRKGPPPNNQQPRGQEGENRNENRPPPPGNGERPMGNPMLKHVRAVRGNTYGENDFKDNGNGTITDNATGLMWAKNDSEQGLDWKNALYYAENSELAGYSDWRLPNVKELQGIVDYNFAPEAKDASKDRAAIHPLFNISDITNENGDKDYPYFWTSTSARFQKGKPYYYAWYVAFGRAVSQNGLDSHGAGAVRFDTKHENGPAGEGGERYYNYVRLVRNVD
ncbi:Lcl C-terminal domain-containing protein [Winogradskyella endarachnes]|uniref:DUF1566 domain-containing protein n=1 Tax=Winogradskyella endarachnes TaxID=2681965 RepID=A0A6L6U561_9FLAO|nr:DUF1566 domain-containing protein [Winogradskyella endarachnes]MUU77158.1 DUF1566 domain-containing protein [Winogradskyella endarachnes]